MRTLHLRNVPDDVAARLEEIASSESLSLNAFAVRELTDVARRSYNARLFEGLPDVPVGLDEMARTSGPPVRPVIVADASLVCDALMAAGPARDQLVADAVAVPHLADAEVVDAVRRPVRRGELRHDDAGARLARWASSTARRHDTRPLRPRVWALRDTLTAYDAMYVALAEALG